MASAGAIQGTEGGAEPYQQLVAVCAYVACKVMRGAAAEAYGVSERSMVAGDIIPYLYPTFKRVVGCS